MALPKYPPQETHEQKLTRTKGRMGRIRKGRQGLTQVQQEALLELLLGRFEPYRGGPAHGMTHAQIALTLGLSESTVIKYNRGFAEADPEIAKRLRFKGRAEIIQETAKLVKEIGQAPPAFEPTPGFIEPKSGGINPFRPLDVPTVDALPEPNIFDPLDPKAVELMSPDAMMQVLTHVAQTAQPQYRIAAIQALDRLMATYKPAESFGPPEPLTPAQRQARLIRLFECVGPELIHTSLESLWPGTFSFDGSMLTSPSMPSSPPASPEPQKSSTSKPEAGSSPTSPTPSDSGWTESPATDSSEGSTPSPGPLS